MGQRRPSFLKRHRLASYAVVGCLGLASVLYILGHSRSSESQFVQPGSDWTTTGFEVHIPDLTSPSQFGSDSDLNGRPVYPYSVVKGGVRSIQELQDAISRDPVVKAHYSDFNLAKSRIIRLQTAKTAYVSYRINKDVFWTKKKIKLATGEKLITDGANYARTRCANRISEKPQQKTSPYEPSEEAFNTPLRPPSGELMQIPLPPTLAAKNAPSPEIGPVVFLPPSSGGGVIVPPIPIIFPSGSPANPPHQNKPPSPPAGGTPPNPAGPVGGGVTPNPNPSPNPPNPNGPPPAGGGAPSPLPPLGGGGGATYPPPPLGGGSPMPPPGGEPPMPLTPPWTGDTPPTPVPEPGTLLLVSSGLASLLACRKKFRK